MYATTPSHSAGIVSYLEAYFVHTVVSDCVRGCVFTLERHKSAGTEFKHLNKKKGEKQFVVIEILKQRPIITDQYLQKWCGSVNGSSVLPEIVFINIYV